MDTLVLHREIVECRVIKTQEELAVLRYACNVTCKAHREVRCPTVWGPLVLPVSVLRVTGFWSCLPSLPRIASVECVRSVPWSECLTLAQVMRQARSGIKEYQLERYG